MAVVYSVSSETARLDRKATQARERRARQRQRREAHRVLRDMKVLELENILKRAPRKQKDRGNRTLRLKGNVAAMVRQLVFWEGKGEADADWIWKTADEWYREAGITYRMLRVNRDVAKAEGLLDYELRGDVGEERVYYKLDMTAVLRVVARSEMQSAKDWLEKHPRSKKRPEWKKKLAKWNQMLEDLEAWGVAEPDDTSDAPEPTQSAPTPLTTCKVPPDNLSDLQESTSSGFPLSEDTSSGGKRVADLADDAPATSTKKISNERFQGMKHASLAYSADDEDELAIGYATVRRVCSLMSGEAGRYDLAHMVADHIDGDDTVTVEAIAERASEELGDEASADYVLGAVEFYLTAMRDWGELDGLPF